MPKDLQELPKLRDSISYIYLEHATIEQEDLSIAVRKKGMRLSLPVSSLTCLMLGPGTSITHAAIKTANENGCMVMWCGEYGARFYAAGHGETRSAKNILLQATLLKTSEVHLPSGCWRSSRAYLSGRSMQLSGRNCGQRYARTGN